MGAYTIYRDGEEVEVGRFGMVIEVVRGFIRGCRKTDWKHFFQGNGPGEVTWKKFTGFKETQNELGFYAQWIIQVKGGIRPREGNCFFRTIIATEFQRLVDVEFSAKMKRKVADQEDMLDLYASPDCNCREGFHWKCRHHGTWEN